MDEKSSESHVIDSRQRALTLMAEKNTFYGECHFSALRRDIKMFPGAF